jgi:hypothetical protein
MSEQKVWTPQAVYNALSTGEIVHEQVIAFYANESVKPNLVQLIQMGFDPAQATDIILHNVPHKPNTRGATYRYAAGIQSVLSETQYHVSFGELPLRPSPFYR